MFESLIKIIRAEASKRGIQDWRRKWKSGYGFSRDGEDMKTTFLLLNKGGLNTSLSSYDKVWVVILLFKNNNAIGHDDLPAMRTK